MSIPAKKVYPRTGDRQTVYLEAVVREPGISVGAYTIYNDFVNDPLDFEKTIFFTATPLTETVW